MIVSRQIAREGAETRRQLAAERTRLGALVAVERLRRDRDAGGPPCR